MVQIDQTIKRIRIRMIQQWHTIGDISKYDLPNLRAVADDSPVKIASPLWHIHLLQVLAGVDKAAVTICIRSTSSLWLAILVHLGESHYSQVRTKANKATRSIVVVCKAISYRLALGECEFGDVGVVIDEQWLVSRCDTPRNQFRELYLREGSGEVCS